MIGDSLGDTENTTTAATDRSIARLGLRDV